MGDQSDHIGKTSWRGGSLEWKGVINDKMSAGIETAWNTFYEKLDRDSYTFDNFTLTGKQFRYHNVIPIYGRFDYYGGTDGDKTRLIGGLGVGTMWSEVITDFGLYSFIGENWHFALSPRIGFNYYLNDWRALNVSLNYDYGFETKEAKAVSYLRLSVGVSFIN